MTDYQHEKTLQDHRAWLGTLAPEGLVVSPAVLADAQVVLGTLDPERQRLFTSLTARRGDVPEGRELTPEQADEFFLPDIPRFLTDFLGWPTDLLLGTSPAQPIPDALKIPLPELNEELVPSYVLADPKPKDASRPWLILVKVLPVGTDLDKETTGDSAAWTASPTRRFERLLRETGVPIGLLTAGTSLRLVYAPRGESAGVLTFPVGFMREVAGRRVLAALEMLLSRQCLLAAPTPARLPTLLAKSRDFQATVSTALAQQVIDAAFELVRGFQAANEKTGGTLLADVLATRPNEVYEGLLTVLMRLVFTLYAEDRGLLPSSSLYQQHYGVHGLFERLRGDAAKHPDTMDLRYGGWAQLVALFRLIYSGSTHPDIKLPARSGYLFDPDRFPWLEGHVAAAHGGHAGVDPPASAAGGGRHQKVPAVPDGTLHRVLEKLLVLDGERLSYRTLDVEQIGSVYEVMMGFGVGLADGPSIAIKPKKKHGAPVPVNLDALLATKPADRAKTFETETDHKLTAKQSAPLKDATTTDDLLAALEAAKKIARSATPQPLAAGAMLLVPSDERRRSGSNYTPRKLTEPIVRKTLEPILANLGEKPTPGQLLDLKICDPAMGSGAFLVEACRQLADHLVVAWQRHGGMPPVPPDEDELLLAKRLVAQKCLYGVDKNPMAADLAKLSLWLATLAKDHPFTFLDHSLRSGDSLVGLTRKQISSLHWEETKQLPLVADKLTKDIRRAGESRTEILNGGDFLTPEFKQQKLSLADDALSLARLIGDAVIAAFFSAAKPRDRQKTLDHLVEPIEDLLRGKSDYTAARSCIADLVNWLHGKPRDPRIAASTDALAPAEPISQPLKPFHWEIEFPEVFQKQPAGFDALIGNPPFLGGPKLSELFGGPEYQDWLKEINPGAFGNADLCAYFFRLAFDRCMANGAFGFLATNTIYEGGTRTTGLQHIIREGGRIYNARRSLRWPGEAAVIVSVVHITGPGCGRDLQCTFDDIAARVINSRLQPSAEIPDPVPLRANDNLGFMGAGLRSSGFVLDAAEHASLWKDAVNRPCLMPLLGGEEVNTSPTQSHERYAINFGSRTLEEASAFPVLLEIVRLRVKPDRDRQKDHGPGLHGKKYWWQYALRSDPLYEAIRDKERCLVTAITTSHLTFSFQPTRQVFTHSMVACAFDRYEPFSCLQSRAHEIWAYLLSSSLGEGLRYSVSDALQTFPFPENFESDAVLEAAGKDYYEYRAALMVRNDEGLTKTYNRFHDPGESSAEIARLRELHAAMDRAVLDAYGWRDVRPECGFALDWLDLDDDELADTLASAPDDIRERIEAADYFFPSAAAACRFQSHIKQSGKGKLPWRYRWTDETRDDILARLLALNAHRAELERLTGLPGAGTAAPRSVADSAFPAASAAGPDAPTTPKPNRAKKAAKRSAKKSAPRPLLSDDDE